MNDRGKGMSLYRVNYTIFPTQLRSRWGVNRIKTGDSSYNKRIKEKKILRRLTYKCKELGHAGCDNEVLLVAKDDFSVESQFLDNIPPLPRNSRVTINCIKRVADEFTTKDAEGGRKND